MWKIAKGHLKLTRGQDLVSEGRRMLCRARVRWEVIKIERPIEGRQGIHMTSEIIIQQTHREP